MQNERVLIIGGGSGMGLALARQLLDAGSEVTIAGRSADRLAAAARELGDPKQLTTSTVDIADEDGVRDLTAAERDHVVVTAADAAGSYHPIRDFPLADAQNVLATKVLGPWLVAKHAAPHLRAGGSITFTSGVAAYRPGPGSSVLATANGALESLARTLAIELAPIRVNVVSPGWVDTEIWDTLAGPAKNERLAAMAAKLPAGRVGHPDDIAAAFRAAMTNGFMTGTVLHVDGGHRLV
ncbi:NAD(P)-dependent dehydrogenase (short-subunit alcohol dehydrogenase family) [Actinoplanes tereljensis]|uniref:Short chain dehydrogenase n=1 Tax=Paractinoplanes tereljensis TaxID=571912 RepID=A0A919TZK2_9ACTN|nr:SDR family oxidoreductase [Actinoplanes tereljensis]GIF25972.1 short chain dehydrogenase [Actinoplanes tereljensis]